MSLLDIDTTGAQEPKVIPAGSECKVRIIDVRHDTDKNGNPYLMPRFDIVDEPLAKDFTDFMGLSYDGQSEKEKERADWKVKTFLASFDLPDPYKGAPEDMQGHTGWAILGVKTDDTYGEQNTVRKYVTGK